MNQQLVGFLYFLAIWLATGLVNLALTKRTPEEWEAWAEANPRLGSFARFLRRAGLNLPAIIRAASSALNARAGTTTRAAQ